MLKLMKTRSYIDAKVKNDVVLNSNENAIDNVYKIENYRNMNCSKIYFVITMK